MPRELRKRVTDLRAKDLPPGWTPSQFRDLDPRSDEIVRDAMLAKGFEGTADVRLHRNYNGSGPQAFGGARDWPVLTVHVPFQVGEEARRDELALRLMREINRFLDKEA